MTQKQYVRDLKEKDSVQSIFLASDKLVGTDKNGKPYLSVNLNDATGSINGRLWEKVPELSDQFTSGDFVEVKGHVQVYQNRKQIVLYELKKAGAEQVQMKDFISKSQSDPEALYKELVGMAEGMREGHLKQLVLGTLQDPEIRVKLLTSPAAKTIHHAYLGGLIEHVVSICNILKAIGSHYTELDPDLLLFGGIFHDIGKVWELEVGSGVTYTDGGRLVGHMVMACDLVDRKAREITGFPPELLEILKHIILSHHGRIEYGSPKLPMLPEAVIVAMIDELDSRMNTILGFMKNELETGERWTKFHSQLDRYFYLDILRARLKK